jgi:hypothetical protein
MVALGVFRPEQIGPSAVQHASKFGAMGLKGAVRLGYSKELEAQPAGEARALKLPILVSVHCARNMAPTQSATATPTVSLAATTRPCISMPWIWSDRCSACTRTPSSSSRVA